MADPDIWFEPKRYGYGAGLPVAWQGWALLLAYLAVLVAAGALMPRHPWLFGIVVVVATAALLPIVAARTRGGWRWRWGADDD